MLTWLKVYEICTKYDFYSMGCKESYNKMFEMIKCGAEIHDVAIAIYVNSETKHSIKEIEEILEREIRID